MPITVGVPRETFPGERRVAITPRQCDALQKSGIEVLVEHLAGSEAGFPDEDICARGSPCEPREIFQAAEIIAQVRCLGANPEEGRSDLPLLRRGQALDWFRRAAYTALKECSDLAGTGVSFFAMELMPRITRAQSMDALVLHGDHRGISSCSAGREPFAENVPDDDDRRGYDYSCESFCAGAGVAGLQAIATARRLGAVVCAYDVRPAVKEQVESVGAKFVTLDVDAQNSQDKGGYAKAMDEAFYRRQRELMTDVLREQDVVITTAAVPGRKAPTLITADMVSAMLQRFGDCRYCRRAWR